MTETKPARLVDELIAKEEPRILFEVPLKPLIGSRFQPTGFPDLGAAQYRDPTGTGERLLVESAQSMANRLEAVCWDEAEDDLVEPLRGMPFVRVEGDGVHTSSILEAHRLNSPYVLKADGGDFEKAFKERAGLGKGTVSRPEFAAALLHYDPNSLVHGAFMSQIKPGTARLERMLSGFIEAENVEVVESGGVKIDRNDTSGKDAGGSSEGFGNVPFHRTEFAAERIYAAFAIDLSAVRGLRLPEPGARLVALLALYKVRRFLDAPMRLRTACDLEVDDGGDWKVRPSSLGLPSHDALAGGLAETIAEAQKAGLFADPAVTVLRYGKA
ncbi:MAG TPA: type I-U CRISPR-associated RAMP protein Csb1/Cas7u [Sandaracinaceae bacterium LLY-WYZ-13_1]|nr:type I-U CRISPR-associated RAMP protein Csb1/Cas7u [Sandaracinaceae bacterium LLY-WYZ-13_1]